MAQQDMSQVEFRDGSYHFGPRAPWTSDKACHFYNTSKCLKGEACKFNPKTDDRSLRLVLKFSTDQTSARVTFWANMAAGLPTHDKEALRKTIIMLEARIYRTVPSDLASTVRKLEQSLEQDMISADDFVAQIESVQVKEMQEAPLQWRQVTEKQAKDTIARAVKGEFVQDAYQGKEPAVDVAGLSGVDILRACGVDEPFANRDDRKEHSDIFAVLSEDDDDEWEDIDDGMERKSPPKKFQPQKKRLRSSRRTRPFSENDMEDDMEYGMGPYGFSEDDIFEHACQGVKPWDDDAGDVLAMLNGGF